MQIPVPPFSAGWKQAPSPKALTPKNGIGGPTQVARAASKATAKHSLLRCSAGGLARALSASQHELLWPRAFPRLSVGITRGMRRLGLAPGSSSLRAVLATARAIADSPELPGPGDFETEFRPGRAHVRRVARENLWILYRFDAQYVDVLTVRNDPPVPADDEP